MLNWRNLFYIGTDYVSSNEVRAVHEFKKELTEPENCVAKYEQCNMAWEGTLNFVWTLILCEREKVISCMSSVFHNVYYKLSRCCGEMKS